VKRATAVFFLLLALSACAAQERPEGIVERWLLALNQGRAGEPDRYAEPSVSSRILPGYATVDPGEFDVVEVGRATPSCGVSGWFVPFRVVLLSRTEIRSVACTDAGRVVELIRTRSNEAPDNLDALPSEGGPAIGSAGTSGWLLALGTGMGLILLSEAAMRLVRRGASS